MNIFEHDGMFKAARITGPKHHYLGIAFSELEQPIEFIERQLPNDKKLVESTNTSEACRLVQEIVLVQAQKYGKKLFIAKLEFAPTDSFDALAYTELATAIANYALEKCIHVSATSEQ
jgi:hypothetical protein